MVQVSYIIPCYNSRGYILTCIESVLSQQCVSFDVIVIDDGSTDDSYDLVSSYIDKNPTHPITLLSHSDRQNKGVSASRRLGTNYSKADYICFLDSDDYIIHPHKTLLQLKEFATDPSLVMVHTAVSVVGISPFGDSFSLNFQANIQFHSYYLFTLADFLSGNHICTSTVMIRRHFLLKTSFDTSQVYQFEDWSLWLLLSRWGKFRCLPIRCVAYRIHENSSTSFVHKDRLRYLYSLLECKLIVLCRAGFSMLAIRILFSFRSDIRDLLRSYSISGESGQILSRRERAISSVIIAILYPLSTVRSLLKRSMFLFT
jgi:glycosyltransferase involved in cell wall biosynthesis